MPRFGRDDDDAQHPKDASPAGSGKATAPAEPTERRREATQEAPETRDEREPIQPKPGHQQPLEREPDERTQTPERQVYELRNVKYRLNGAQVVTLNAIGAFRTVRAEDALESVYHGDKAAFERDLKQLRTQNLVTVSKFRGRPQERFLALPREAKHLVDSRLKANPDQQIYSGLVKVKELDHDGALYKMYTKAIEGIERDGGKPKRVVLDYELKKTLNRELDAAKKLPKDEETAKLQELAERHNLKLVDGKIPLPDVRVEYQTREGDIAQLDLEYVTGNYRSGAIAAKARAGFSLYAPSGFQNSSGGSAGRKVQDEYPSLAADIISL